jgi:hypothetical protein
MMEGFMNMTGIAHLSIDKSDNKSNAIDEIIQLLI